MFWKIFPLCVLSIQFCIKNLFTGSWTTSASGQFTIQSTPLSNQLNVGSSYAFATITTNGITHIFATSTIKMAIGIIMPNSAPSGITPVQNKFESIITCKEVFRFINKA